VPCYKKTTHAHPMTKLGLDLDDSSGTGAGGVGASSATVAEARRNTLQVYTASLEHACCCRDANCFRMSCQKMKKLIAHMRVCKGRFTGGCPKCKQLMSLCFSHAKTCLETKCQVPLCVNIKQVTTY